MRHRSNGRKLRRAAVGKTTGLGNTITPLLAAALDATYRKVSWRLLPFLMLLWILAWIDRVNIGFARLQMLDALHLSEAAYGLGAGIFFIGYFLFEVPSNLLLAKIGAKRTIARITIAWGITSVGMMFVRSAGAFYVLRFLLGVFEAGFYPGIILYLTYWYPPARRARAFGLFMSASALAGVIGGPLAGLILTRLDGANGWMGWQWVFLLEGIPSILAGLATLAWLVDRPAQARWLTAAEQTLLREDHARAAPPAHDGSRGALAGLTDRRVWLCIAIFFGIVTANSALTFWGPALVRELGIAAPTTIGWIMAGAYLCGGAGMILNGAHSDRAGEVRYHCAVAALASAVCIALLGLVLPHHKLAALLLLTAAITGTMSAIPVFWQLPARLLSGAAAAAGIALINAVANLAGFVAPAAIGAVRGMTGRLSDGLLGVAACEALAVALILLYIPRVPAIRNAQPIRRRRP